ncbi:CBS domain-containing protein [Roseomonas alkaliterrae]|jgi:CBS domain-containing protein|uniref:CBS domain-containing protein n=1 Tax=Neoroseomonas alkaliterrae TaxID=1452450 RepID=A0A840XTX4_9PROT|nr:CBS domain-containing protein [Neoroseomonas alkaliterrae]MBB5690099.1 CBS domain-containing protein [Neoroseomonas alkaliterrae]MBR0676199.1 CBS domain-containing protein [Neoroseomonas alkaliterrae]
MTIAAVLARKGSEVVAVRPETLAVEVARLITSRRIGAVLVTDAAGKLVGIVSERDIVRAVAQRPNATHGVFVRDIMTRNVVTVGPETSVQAGLETMERGYFRHLPVVDGEGALLGIVSVRDLVKHLLG